MTNEVCTMYKFDKVTGGFTRHFLGEVYWNESKGAKVSKSGLVSADNVQIVLFNDEVLPEAGKDILVKGNILFEFDNSSEAAISSSLKSFRKEHPDFVTVTAVDKMMYGGLPHIEISAK